MAGNVKLMTSAGGGVVLDTATTTATDVTVKIPVTGVNNGTLVCSDSSGNVGIGTSSPSYKLDVNSLSASNVVGRFTNNSGYYTYLISSGATSVFSGDTSGNNSFTVRGGSNQLELYTNGAERMRIDSSGNLLIGTTSNTANGSKVKIDAGSIYAIETVRNSTASSTHLLFVNPNGIVGNITTTGTSTAFNTTSDYRLKENIQPMQNALGVVAQLNPVTYTWKADGSDGQGFIAHELQAVVPDCVTGEKDAVDTDGNPVYQGIDTSFLSATLTKAIQELKAMVDAQAAEIAELKAKLA